MTRRCPFGGLPEVQIILAIRDKMLPLFPSETFVGADKKEMILWERLKALCLQCWEYDPKLRPAMEEIAASLTRL